MAPQISEEQLLYSKILDKGMMLGLIGLVITFAAYAFGIFKPKIPVEQIQNYWVMPVSEYLEKSGIHTGWAWLGNLGYGDMLNFLPIAFLLLVTVICYLAIIPGLMRKKDTAYITLAVIEVIFMLVAASGILGPGGY
jgi:uncharacterized membrane protein